MRFPAYGSAGFALVNGAAAVPIGAARMAVSGRVTLRVTLSDGRGYDVALLTALPGRDNRARRRRHAHALGAADALERWCWRCR